MHDRLLTETWETRGLVAAHAARDMLRRAGYESQRERWLSRAEWEVGGSLADGRRREAWLFGRVLAKHVILGRIRGSGARGRPVRPSEIHIDSHDGLRRATRPRITVDGRLQPWSLSIAHSDQSVLVAFSDTPGLSVGADLTPTRAEGQGFLETWMTAAERAWLRDRDEPRLASTLWAIKEAVYKASNANEPFTPRRVEVCRDAGGRWSARLGGAAAPDVCQIHVARVGCQQIAAIAILTYRHLRAAG